ncbi:CMRF35-like molecule 6 [Willisornis vidua]|uniref:CMRF35-like molecule 6 n=1 Tax=Willisornis vidua TaxID=1566151 RepID=A0ABQ9DYG5_9PASS|nr:CMRF35-like molecule 6 [Willisornis vidua]
MRIFLVWTLFPGGWAVTGPKQVTADQGSSLAVSCSYKPGYEKNSKYWCRQNSLGVCFTFIIQTSGSEVTVTQGRVSIRDNHTAHSFTVTLSDVMPGDAGQYSCGVKRKLWFNRSHTTRVMVSAGYRAVTGPGTVQGFLGGSLSVTCMYQPGLETKPKFWCKPGLIYPCHEDIIITSESQPVVRQGRFSIRDNRTHRAFTVTVEGLSKEDIGSFRCGVRLGLHRLYESVDVRVIVLSARFLRFFTPATVTTPLWDWGHTEGGGVTLREGGWRRTRCPPGTGCVHPSFTPATPTLQPDAPHGTRGSFRYFPVLAGLQLLALLAMIAAVLWVSLRD